MGSARLCVMSQDAVVFVRKVQEVWVSCSGNLFFTLIWLKFDLMTRRSSKESDYPHDQLMVSGTGLSARS